MYESPIKVIETMMDDFEKIKSNYIFSQVKMHVDVNESELKKALAYDRQQYQKGYYDGICSAVTYSHWIGHINRDFPADSRLECANCGCEIPLTIDDDFCPHCGASMHKEVEK